MWRWVARIPAQAVCHRQQSLGALHSCFTFRSVGQHRSALLRQFRTLSHPLLAKKDKPSAEGSEDADEGTDKPGTLTIEDASGKRTTFTKKQLGFNFDDPELKEEDLQRLLSESNAVFPENDMLVDFADFEKLGLEEDPDANMGDALTAKLDVSYLTDQRFVNPEDEQAYQSSQAELARKPDAELAQMRSSIEAQVQEDEAASASDDEELLSDLSPEDRADIISSTAQSLHELEPPVSNREFFQEQELDPHFMDGWDKLLTASEEELLKDEEKESQEMKDVDTMGDDAKMQLSDTRARDALDAETEEPDVEASTGDGERDGDEKITVDDIVDPPDVGRRHMRDVPEEAVNIFHRYQLHSLRQDLDHKARIRELKAKVRGRTLPAISWEANAAPWKKQAYEQARAVLNANGKWTNEHKEQFLVELKKVMDKL